MGKNYTKVKVKEETHTVKYSYAITEKKQSRGENTSQKSKKGKKCKKDSDSLDGIKKEKTDYFFNVIMGVIDFLAIIFVILIILGNVLFEFNENIYLFASDIVAVAGLISMIFTFSKPQKFMEKIFYMPDKAGEKLLIAFFTFILAVLGAWFLYEIGVSNKVSDIISLICITLSLINLQLKRS